MRKWFAALLRSILLMLTFNVADSPAAPDGGGEGTVVISRSFEFRAVSDDPKADGESDLKGDTSVFSTEDRVAFLAAYADYASAWFGDLKLDTLAATPAEAQLRLAVIKSQPLPCVRRTIRLNDGWKQLGVASATSAALNDGRPWRNLPGVVLRCGRLDFPAGRSHILDLNRSAGWRYELAWKARLADDGCKATWTFGNATNTSASCALAESSGWHDFRLQADLTLKRGYLSRNGRRISDFALAHEAGRPSPLAVAATGKWSLDDLVLIDYQPTNDVRRPSAGWCVW